MCHGSGRDPSATQLDGKDSALLFITNRQQVELLLSFFRLIAVAGRRQTVFQTLWSESVIAEHNLAENVSKSGAGSSLAWGEGWGDFLVWMALSLLVKIPDHLGVQHVLGRNPGPILWIASLPGTVFPLPRREERIRRQTLTAGPLLMIQGGEQALAITMLKC